MSKELNKTLSKIKFIVLPQNFLIINIPLNQYEKFIKNFKKIKNDFYSLILEKEGITLIISNKSWNKIKSSFNKHKIETGYKIVTYNTNTDLNLVGFLSIISKILAGKGISLNVIFAYHRDYFLIKKSKVKLAVRELNKLTDKYKK